MPIIGPFKLSFKKSVKVILLRDFLLLFMNFIISIFIARKLGPSQFGVWSLLMVVTSYFEGIGRLQFDVASVYFIGKKKSDIGEVFFLLKASTLISIVMIVTLTVVNIEYLSTLLFEKDLKKNELLLYSALLLFLARSLVLNYSYLFIATQKIVEYSYLTILQAAMYFFLIVLFFLFFELTLVHVVVANISGVLLAILFSVFYFHYRSRSKIKIRIKTRLLPSMFFYSLNLYAGNILSSMFNYFPILISSSILPVSQIGFFSIAKSLSDLATRILPSALNLVLFPKLTRIENKEDMSFKTAKAFRITFFLLTLVALLSIVVIEPFIVLVYGELYTEVSGIFKILVFSFLFMHASSIFSTFFNSVGRPDIPVKILVIPSILSVSMCYLLTILYGVNGLAYGFLIGSSSLFLIRLIVFVKISMISFSQLLILRKDFSEIRAFFISP